MKALALLLCGSLGAAQAAAPKSVQKTPAKASSSKKKSSKTARGPSRPPRQAQPTPDRYREIQQALIEKGFLDGSPTGAWDQRSVDALKKFERSQSLTEDGKLDSMTIISLGLGPKRQPLPAQPPGTQAAPVKTETP